MITSSYDVDFVEDAFDFTLKISLTFNGIISAKAGSSVLNMRDMDTMITSAPPGSSVLKVRDMDTVLTSAPRRVDMLILCLVMMLDIRRLLRMPTFSLRFLVSLRIHQLIPVHRFLMRSVF